MALGIGIVGALAVSVTQKTSSPFWALINILLLIYYIPVHNIGMKSGMMDALSIFGPKMLDQSLGGLISYNKENYPNPPKNWREYGIETTSLLVNLSSIMLLLCLLILIHLLGWLGYIFGVLFKNPIVRLYSDRVWRWFNFSAFIRFWVEVYVIAIVGFMLSAGSVFFI